MIIHSPLRVNVYGNKWFVLNLNQYRNTNFHILNKAKILYNEIIRPEVLKLPILERIKIHYTLYPKTKRKCDLDNVLSIQAKFFQDSLVKNNRIEEDNYLFVIGSSQSFGEVDSKNPRVEIKIEEIK